MKKEKDLEAKMPDDKKTVREVQSDKVLKGYFDKAIKLEKAGKKTEAWEIVNSLTKDEKSIFYNYCSEIGSAEGIKLMLLNSLS
tara:strand:- start:77 stop:328 length:252 start_codon:yes stop_codon:yes gene_type:complete